MEYIIKHNPEQNRFEVRIEGLLSVIEYEVIGNTLFITHTIVPRELEGRGIAAALTKHLLEYAKENGMKVKPLCSYAIRYLEKHPEYSDIIAL